jgi:two-component system, NarL family, invasion response regulator UvrY
MIRIAIAEAQALVRWALREALAKRPDLEIVGEAGTVEETLAMLAHAKPDLLLLDPAVPDHSGFDVLAAIREMEAGPLVIVLAPFVEPTFAARAIDAGAHGYLGKSAEPEKLIDAIHAVSRGEQVIPAGVEKLLSRREAQAAGNLTNREHQVMEMLARGMTNREISVHLNISIKTVDTHRGHLLKKLGLRNNADLTRFAVKHGYVTV